MKQEILKEFKDKFEEGILSDNEGLSCLGGYYFYDKIEEFISKSLDKAREETIKQLLNIELAVNDKTIKEIDDCKNKSEAFGYGQCWVMRKVEELNKLK